jgi:beta-fructofuranosidase
MEIDVEFEPKDASEISLCVLRSPDKTEYTTVSLLQNDHTTVTKGGSKHKLVKLVLDSTHSSASKEVRARPAEVAPLELQEGEPLRLQVFVDRSVVEVFANDRQCVALRVYPHRKDSLGVSLCAQDGDAVLRSLDAWQMQSIYAKSTTRTARSRPCQ